MQIQGAGTTAPQGGPQVFSAPGFSAQHVQVAVSGGYDFSWKGKSHYLALHDLQNVDGETRTDSCAVVRRRDVRGRLTFIPAGCRAWGWSLPKDTPQSFTALYFDPRETELAVSQRCRRLPDQALLYFSDFALRSTLDKVHFALSSSDHPDSMYVETLGISALIQLCILQRELTTSQLVPGKLSAIQASRVTDFVESHLGQSIGLGDLARVAGLSRFHFLRAFKGATQQTPYQYLLSRRFEKARHLLLRSNLAITDVAIAVGFKDSSRFIRMFRKTQGVTPGAFRERAGRTR